MKDRHTGTPCTVIGWCDRSGPDGTPFTRLLATPLTGKIRTVSDDGRPIGVVFDDIDAARAVMPIEADKIVTWNRQKSALIKNVSNGHD